MIKKGIVFLALVFLVQCAHQEPKCKQRRAAFDIGSGSTRVLIAEVDLCRKLIGEIFYKDEQELPYREMLDGKLLSAKSILLGKALIQKYLNKAKDFKVDKVLAVGTEVFRTAKNGQAYVDELKRDLNFDLRIIDQKYEAILGFEGVLVKTGFDPASLIVWDVGGGSTQIVSQGKEGYQFYFPQIASVSFKEIVVREIQKKDLRKIKSPNPISYSQMKKAEKVAEELILKEAAPVWLKSLALNPKLKVIGIGGVHYYSIRGQLLEKKDSYKLQDLEKALIPRLNKTDIQIGGDYASTEVTNLIMVKSMMKLMGFSELSALKLNLTEGLLFQ